MANLNIEIEATWAAYGFEPWPVQIKDLKKRAGESDNFRGSGSCYDDLVTRFIDKEECTRFVLLIIFILKADDFHWV